jgi:hypothetical protein
VVGGGKSPARLNDPYLTLSVLMVLYTPRFGSVLTLNLAGSNVSAISMYLVNHLPFVRVPTYIQKRFPSLGARMA